MPRPKVPENMFDSRHAASFYFNGRARIGGKMMILSSIDGNSSPDLECDARDSAPPGLELILEPG
jgi:hypothetical protein